MIIYYLLSSSVWYLIHKKEKINNKKTWRETHNFSIFSSPPFRRTKGEPDIEMSSVRSSVNPALRVRSITQPFTGMKGFWNNLAQMFTIIIQGVMWNSQTPILKVNVIHREKFNNNLSDDWCILCPVVTFSPIEWILKQLGWNAHHNHTTCLVQI